jgi:hypothetical protein
VTVFGDAVAAVSVVGPAGGFDARAAGTAVQATVAGFARKLALTEIFGERVTDSPAVPELVFQQNVSVR